MSGHIFISHASADDDFVKDLRTALEDSGLSVWVDSRKLRGGDKLALEIQDAIAQARQVIVVLSQNTINSPWVRREIEQALQVEKQRKADGYRVIPLLLPGVQPSALPLWFDEEPVGVKVELKTGSVSEAMPAILAALGERLPTDPQPAPKAVSQPLEELVLKLTDPRIETIDNKRRAMATATVIYEPADGSRSVESTRFSFTAPLGPIETDELRWYLERYYLWPVGLFKERAARVESQLPNWGQDLYKAALASDSAKEILAAWQNAADGAARCFSIFIDSALPEGASEHQRASANEAASELLSLPWELLRDGGGYLFQGAGAVRVRRRMPNRRKHRVALAGLPIRILLVSPRPEDKRAAYIDHRLSARPLMDAIDSLGELVKLTVLSPPTFPALEKALKHARKRKEPFDAVHFDGHGVFNREHGLGALCFEDPKDTNKLEQRASELIDADKLASVMRNYRIPLVFLEACQTATQENDPTASVAAKLLEEGVASVVAMSHSVLVETAHRFVRAFYAELAQGSSTGAAMLAGQCELYGDTWRGKVMGAGELELQDWFVPVLYQEEHDASLITELLSKEVKEVGARQRKLRLGELPPEPNHKFQGRSRELLKLERLLIGDQYAVVRGQGGAGKTTLAVELARWLVRARRFRRAAFLSLEEYSDARGVLDRLGQQLVPENYSVAEFKDLKEALQPVERALRDSPTIIVLDNFESLLPSADATDSSAIAESREEILKLAQDLLNADPATRIVFTSREPLPSPFDHARRDVRLGALDRTDAIALVSEVMKQEGLEPKADDPGGTPKEIEELVDAVNCHARALELLARELAKQGVRATTENLHRLMAELDRRHPDNRQNSLYASIELSLRRLPPEMREQAKALAVFHGGASLMVLNHVLEIAKHDTETVQRLAAALIEVGLAEDMGYGHLKLDPALPSYVLRKMTEAEVEAIRTRWAGAMQALTQFLYRELFKDVQIAAILTQYELPNLMAMLLWLQDRTTPETVIEFAHGIETLASQLGRKSALTQAIRVREEAALKLRVWSRASYLSKSATISRLFEQGDLPAAHAAAQQLLRRCMEAGVGAYPEADYDIAMAHFSLGQVLADMEAAEVALQLLGEAQRRFENLARNGNVSAEGMYATTMTKTADCLRDLGRLDEAASLYQEAIRRDEKLGRKRGVAVCKGQLGTVRMLQNHYDEALTAYEEALTIFESLGEPGSVAVAWHLIGRVHSKTRRFNLAEQAYRQSLRISVNTKNLAAEATSLGELAILYDSWGRLEEAVTFYKQAVDAENKLQNLSREGLIRSNLAITLIRLQRYDEARREVLRAIECRSPLGLAAEIWKTWDILFDLEKATGNQSAADAARQKGVESYLAYRHAGGVSQHNRFDLFALVANALQENQAEASLQQLAQILAEDIPERLKSLIPKLQAILQGDRSPNLVDDPSLGYTSVVELQLLLEQNPLPNT
ncbi:MAG TPA: tetratricopeptide repeat protein [Pyrinomonadaceae bacterium]